ncbi:MAG: LysR substrate-binding domain-containing protein, partial [Ferrovibrio sp.]
TALFMRKPRGMQPTAAGERLYQHAKSILRAMATAEKDIRLANDNLSGEISIGMAYSAVKAIGVPLMKTVLETYPKVKLSLTESLSASTLTHLLAAEVDIALVYNPPTDPQLVAEPVLEEQMVCVGTRDMIGDTDAPIRFDDLLSLPIILLRQGVSSRALLDDVGLLRKLEANAKLQMNSVHAIAGALTAGLGCVIGTTLFMREPLESGALHARVISEPTLTRTLHLCHLADRPATFLSETMRRLILGLVLTEIAAGRWAARALTQV